MALFSASKLIPKSSLITAVKPFVTDDWMISREEFRQKVNVAYGLITAAQDALAKQTKADILTKKN